MVTTSPRSVRTVRRSLTVAGAAFAVIAVAAVLASRQGRAPVAPLQDNRAAATVAPSRPAASTASAGDPATVLERFAAGVASGPADPPRRAFEYIDERVWESPPALPSGQLLGHGPARHYRFWTTGRGSSRAVVIDETRGCPPEDQSDNDLGPFDGPLSSDPDAVRRQILHEPLPATTVPDIFGQVVGFYSYRFLPRATRQGVLRMLAQMPGIGVQPAATDPLGRTGFAITWTYRPPMPYTVDKTLIFEPHTGQLLASHSRAHRRPDASTPPDPFDNYEILTLILDSTYTPDTNTPKVTCP